MAILIDQAMDQELEFDAESEVRLILLAFSNYAVIFLFYEEF